jgi:hypothetical protein
VRSRLASLRARRLPVALLTTLALLLVAATASAELTQKGDLFVRFDGGIAPKTLSRTHLTPIAVRIEGIIRSLSPKNPPTLRKIRIALNKGGKLSTKGLQRCHRFQIREDTLAGALSACGPALVGGGGYTAKTTIENQPHKITTGEILLFNSRRHGHAAILAHLYQTSPAPVTSFITFDIRHRGGRFGTVLSGKLEKNLLRNSYLRTIYLNLHREYRYHGMERSYMSASCPTPGGVSIAAYPFARASMSFEDGRTLSSTMTRTCRGD